MIELGQKVRDLVTGFTGIAIYRCEYLHGCVRIGVTPRVVDDGKLGEVQSFDEPALEVVEDTPFADPVRMSGGYESPPRRAADPSR